jgi:putative transposase
LREAGRLKPAPDPHYRHRFPAETISQWLYHVFNLSLLDVASLLAERGVVISYESVRRSRAKFGVSVANGLRRRRPRPEAG